MVASMRDPSERDRQALLTFRLSTVIVLLAALLGWMIADRYFGLGAALETALDAPTTSPLNNEPARNPTCSANAASKTDSSAWATECPTIDSKIETPATTKIVAGIKTKTL
jgi:uncharacterized membrane protein